MKRTVDENSPNAPPHVGLEPILPDAALGSNDGFSVVPLGLQLTRPLERVEIDVYESDLMVFLDAVGAVGHLTDQEIQSMGLDGTPKRVRISAAIDVFTGCILAF
ncbi:MAG: hypothetical protein ACI84R_001057 [Candidatus Azotimanducaceae bacterium]